MKSFPTKASLVLIKILVSSSTALAAGDPTAGQSVFAARCAACRATAAGHNKIGPSLVGIVGSKSGSVPGFNFSIAMKNADVTLGRRHARHPNGSDPENVIADLNTLKK